MKTVVILGAGNVAFHLVRALVENTIQVRQIYNRTLYKAKAIAEDYNIDSTDKISEIQKADLYIISSSDSSIEEMSYHIPYQDALVVHTSGSMPIETLKGSYRKGVLYPLQTFSKERTLKYSKIPFFIETESEKDSEELELLIKKISELIYKVSPAQRMQLHMSAVWVCNFVNYMYSVGEEICRTNHIPFKVLKPLIEETAKKIHDLNPSEAQTGPAKRGDSIIIEKHLQLLTDDKLNKVYSILSKKIQKKYENEL